MAALSKAPAEQLTKALERREQLKALLTENRIGYTRAYSSYDTRKGLVRIKLWDVNKPLPRKVVAEMNELGFSHLRATQWGAGPSIVGYF